MQLLRSRPGFFLKGGVLAAGANFRREKFLSINWEQTKSPVNADAYSLRTPKQKNIEELFWRKSSLHESAMKKLLFAPFIVILLFIASIYWFYVNSQPVSAEKKYSDFLIKKGQSAAQVGFNLHEKGFIKSSLAFKIYIQVTGKSSKVQAGEFRLSPGYSLFQVVETLGKGPVEIWVTIPEGLRREEVAKKFSQSLDKDEVFEDEFLLASKGKEGTLFPDTYLFPKEASASAIVAKMTSIFSSKTAEFFPQGTGLSNEETIVLASLIERETKTDEERPMVAGILMNRLNIDMALQVDAAVQYAVGTPQNWWPILTRDNLDASSKYNTYKYPGLPPAPIANPGISSLKAAFEPEANDYWYYIHDAKGQIHYAKTLSEHNANVAKYLGK